MNISIKYESLCTCRKFARRLLNDLRQHFSSNTSGSIQMVYDMYGKCPLVITHCLLGSKSNWIALSKALNKSLNRTVYAVDLRNHGDSPHSDEFNYELLSLDIQRFLDNLSINKVVIMGHSMGGKAALYYAMKHPDIVEKVIAIDVSPFSSSAGRDNMIEIMRAMKSVQIDSSVSSGNGKKIARQQMLKKIKNQVVVDFLLLNFFKTEQGPFKWRLNIDSLEKNFYENITVFPKITEKLENPVLFIVGLKSDYITPDEETKITEVYPNSKFVYLNTGHWVHAEDPTEVIKEVTIFLK